MLPMYQIFSKSALHCRDGQVTIGAKNRDASTRGLRKVQRRLKRTRINRVLCRGYLP
jgi:hypothetical protein